MSSPHEHHASRLHSRKYFDSGDYALARCAALAAVASAGELHAIAGPNTPDASDSPSRAICSAAPESPHANVSANARRHIHAASSPKTEIAPRLEDVGRLHPSPERVMSSSTSSLHAAMRGASLEVIGASFPPKCHSNGTMLHTVGTSPMKHCVASCDNLADVTDRTDSRDRKGSPSRRAAGLA